MAIDSSTVDIGSKIDVQAVVDGLRQIQVSVGQLGNKLDETTQKSKKHFKESEDGATGLGKALSGVGAELKGIALGFLSLGAARQMLSAITADADRLAKAGIEGRQKLTEVALARGGGPGTAEAIGATAARISATTHMPKMAAYGVIETVSKTMPRQDQTQKMLAVSASVARLTDNMGPNAQQEIAMLAGTLMDANPALSPDAAAALSYTMRRAAGGAPQLFSPRGLAQIKAAAPGVNFEAFPEGVIAGARAGLRGGGIPFLEGLLEKAETGKRKLPGGAEVPSAPGLKGVLDREGLGAALRALMAGTQPTEGLGLSVTEEQTLKTLQKFYPSARAEVISGMKQPGKVFAGLGALAEEGLGNYVKREEAERRIRTSEESVKSKMVEIETRAAVLQADIQERGIPKAFAVGGPYAYEKYSKLRGYIGVDSPLARATNVGINPIGGGIEAIMLALDRIASRPAPPVDVNVKVTTQDGLDVQGNP